MWTLSGQAGRLFLSEAGLVQGLVFESAGRVLGDRAEAACFVLADLERAALRVYSTGFCIAGEAGIFTSFSQER